MKSYKHKYGVTLVEMLIVVAIIALLASMVIGIAGRISNQSKEQLTRNTFALLNAALEQFHDYEYNYSSPYSDFDFPLDCNDYARVDLETTLSSALGGAIVIISNHDLLEHAKYSGGEVLYFFLNRVPESRKTLDKIDGSLITNLNDGGAKIEISIGGKPYYPLLRIIDPWGETLRYDYYEDWVDYQRIYGGTWAEYLDYIKSSKRTFPVITSAGPDRNFNTPDDITSRD